ncbi:DEAD/DEAH box helicase [Microbacterium thalassium]|uniref:DEAD/DEAH box helicase n=1 Tax=Microbacterium thalassium TaxID=362649 RepID=UPI0031E14C01
MPKNKKPAGGRAAKNFEPRYAAKTSYQDRKRRPGESSAGKAGSKSPNHRGYRAEQAESAPKRRWSAQEKAGRDEARAIRSQDRARRDDRGRYEDRPRRDDRARYEDRPRRDDRPRQDERRYEDRARRDDRPRRDERPRYEDRPRRDDRGRYEDRARRDERPRRDDRPRRGDGPSRADWTAKPGATRAHDEHVDVVHERLQARAIQADEVSGTTFADLGLGQNIVRTLADMGAETPFPIQAATVGPILDGADVLARGRTGSGKTIAFGAPLVESILRAQAGKKREFGRAPRALILAPTRELALQIDRTIQPIARSVGLFTTQIYGGVPQARQVGALKKGVDIVIGTPGRIEDLHEQGKLDLSEIRVAVLDEADHMCELGFLEPVQRILRLTEDGSQKLLFSATLDREVAALVDEFLVEPAVYEVAGEDQDSGTIDHRVLVIDHRQKPDILTSLVDREGKTLVFARTRAYAEMLSEQFEDAGVPALALHGDLNQAKRTRNLEKLTSGKVRVLVATDVAARGIHVDDIDLVVQADAPDEYKTYLHRSGRTGRAGRAGTVVTLVTRQRRRRMAELLDRAEIDAPFEDAAVGDDVLEELSGRQVDPTAG